MRVFISSTFVDLIDHRAVVAEVLERMDLAVGRMEVLGARPEEPKAACFSVLDSCDVFIGIYAHRYGFIPSNGDRSITEQEYDYARCHNKKMFCFIVDDNEPWMPKFIESGKEGEKLSRFKDRVKAELTVDFFTKPTDLAYKVSTSLYGLLGGKSSIKDQANETHRIEAPPYFHGAYARTVNGDAVCLGWVKPERCDAFKLYQGFSPGIEPVNRASFEKVEYYNSTGLQTAVLHKGRRHYYRISAIYDSTEGPPSEEICVDTSRIPIDDFKSLSPRLTPVHVAAKCEDGTLVVEWDNPSEVELKYVVYLTLDNKKSIKKMSNLTNYSENTVGYGSAVIEASVAPMLYGNEGYRSNPVKVSQI